MLFINAAKVRIFFCSHSSFLVFFIVSAVKMCNLAVDLFFNYS